MTNANASLAEFVNSINNPAVLKTVIHMLLDGVSADDIYTLLTWQNR